MQHGIWIRKISGSLFASPLLLGPLHKILISRQEIFSDAILAMLAAPTQLVNGLIDTDEDFLRTHAGVSDFSKYSLVQGSEPRRMMPAEFPDLTVAEQDDEGDKRDSVDLRKSKI